MSTTTDAMRAHNAALVAKLLDRGAIPPERKPLALALAGITQGDLWAAQRASSAPTLAPTEPPTTARFCMACGWRACAPKLPTCSFCAAPPTPYRPAAQPPRAAPVADKLCDRCRRRFPLAQYEGYARCPVCRREEAEARRVRREADKAAQSALNKALVSLVTVKVRADGLGMELACRGCGRSVREGAEVAGVICVECDGQPKEAQ